ncbi:DUF4138 domain-containing protein [Mucilaginibacter sp. 5C4]|uniref:DUF4138 domain-containing protein n=1 Tax=Mucilaginibacter sp. 5C4 TaxID=3048589 RepID=UPI002AC9B9BC|nr:DUF4138 domain-containing protein [Mucilaginibacter sp. 5C4]MEB0301538.1 DUF4138 domain-containing protein [Mucilaginibacter sp. 5C4]WPX25337.1 DUF4138 domain-containing protein [Mucilaginibacter sp. 5C4]
MKTLIIIIFLATIGTGSFAQDTAYISRDRTTALFFKSSVKIIGKTPPDFKVRQIENGLITLKAINPDFKSVKLNIQDQNTNQVYHIPVQYSYGRAGRRIEVAGSRSIITVIRTPVTNYSAIGNQLASGKRSDVVDRKKIGGVKAWVNKLSLANNKVFFRLDIRNRSNLPYDVDFIRFYIRDLKTVARMATHEQEIVPLYSNLNKHTTVLKSKEIAKVFGFHRFSLSEDQALNIELYERNGNRHLYLQIKQKDLDDLQTINPAPQQPANTLVASLNKGNYKRRN